MDQLGDSIEAVWAVAIAITVAVVALVIGWFVGRIRLSSVVASSARSNTELTGQLEAERARVAELQEELRAERQLLDEVASRSRMTSRAFRDAVARGYFHPADPRRRRHVSDEVIDLTDSVRGSESAESFPESSEQPRGGRPTFQFDSGTSDTAAFAGAPSRPSVSMSAEPEPGLDRVQTAVRQLRRDIEELMAAAAPEPAIELRADATTVALREEVAQLRAQLAERQVDADSLASELAQRRHDPTLDRLASELAELKARVLDLQP